MCRMWGCGAQGRGSQREGDKEMLSSPHHTDLSPHCRCCSGAPNPTSTQPNQHQPSAAAPGTALEWGIKVPRAKQGEAKHFSALPGWCWGRAGHEGRVLALPQSSRYQQRVHGAAPKPGPAHHCLGRRTSPRFYDHIMPSKGKKSRPRGVQFLIKYVPSPQGCIFTRGSEALPASCRLSTAQCREHRPHTPTRPQLPSIRAPCSAGRRPCSPPPPFLLSSALRPFSAAVPICSDALVGRDVSVPKQGMVPRWAVKSSEGNRGWRFQSNKSKSRTSPPSKVAFLSPDMGENAGKPEVRFSALLPREKHSETHPQPEDRGSLVVCTATSRSGALPPRQRCHSDTSVGIRTQNKARTARCPALTLSPRLGLQRAQHWDSPESRSHDCRLMLIPLHTAHS